MSKTELAQGRGLWRLSWYFPLLFHPAFSPPIQISGFVLLLMLMLMSQVFSLAYAYVMLMLVLMLMR